MGQAPQLRTLYLQYPLSIEENTTAALSARSPLVDLKHLSQLTRPTLGLDQAPIESASLATALRAIPALVHLSLTCLGCTWEEC